MFTSILLDEPYDYGLPKDSYFLSYFLQKDDFRI